MRLTDDHRIEACADAEQMTGGVAPGETVNGAGKLVMRDFPISGEKCKRLVGGARRIFGDSHHLDSIAGRDQSRLGDCGVGFTKPAEGGNDLVVGEREPFTQSDRRAAMIDPDDE